MSTTQLLSAPRRRHRPSVDPMFRGAGLGFLAGLAFGTSLPFVIVALSAAEDGDLTSGVWFEELGSWALILLFAAVIGGFYGMLVGFVAGIGGVIAPERGLRRRIAVTALAVLVGAGTLVFLGLSDGELLAFLPLGGYVVAMGVAAWLIAPFVDGEGRTAR